jgi:hypothetical protein
MRNWMYRHTLLSDLLRYIAVLIAVCFVFGGGQASAEDTQKKYDPDATDARNDNLAQQSNTGASGPDHDNGVSLSEKAGHLDMIQEGETKLVRMPAHLAFRGLADSKLYKELFRELVTSQVPVMFQTMMMVENGAATGYMGSIQSVSNLLNNTVQSADLELKMRHTIDRSGRLEREYTNSVYEGLKRQESGGSGKHLWPVGLFFASGDKLDKDGLTNNHKLERQFTHHPSGGASNGDSLPKGDSSNGNNQSTWKLSEVIWGGDNKSSRNLTELKEFQTTVIGDVEFSSEQSKGEGSSGGGSQQGDPKVVVTKKFVEPTIKQLDIKQSGQGGGVAKASTFTSTAASSADEKLKGINSYRQRKKEDVWKGLYKLLEEYCKFKTGTDNKDKKIFEKVRAASKLTPNMLQDVSSRNMTITINLIDQIFKIWVQTAGEAQEPTKIKCDFSKADPKDSMPDDWEPSKAKFDNCNDDPKKCSRNKWLLKFTDIIALDRLLEEVRGVHEAALAVALGKEDPSLATAWQELMCASVQPNTSASNSSAATMCDVGFYMESLMGENRARWHTELEELAKLAQSLGGSSNFRFQPNNSLSTAGGSFDKSDTGSSGS